MKLRTLLECLISMRDEGVNTNFGICANVFSKLEEELTYTVDYQLDALFDMWLEEKCTNKYYSTIAFPVGGLAEFTKERKSKSFWNNRRRYELLHWLIMKLENPEL